MYKHFCTFLCLSVLLLGECRFALAYDQTTFPVRVYVSPDYADARETNHRVPPAAILALRQGVLDWNRLIETQKDIKENESTTLVLHRDQDEKDTTALNSLGFLQLVDKKEDADLVIIPLDREYLQDAVRGGSALASYNIQGHGLGRIVVAVNMHDSLTMRAIIMHELGHVLGLEHTSSEKCNLMSSVTYLDLTGVALDCRNKANDTHFITLNSQQIAFVRSELESPFGRGPMTTTELSAEYERKLDHRLIDITSKAGIWDMGMLQFDISPDSKLQNIRVLQSFGSSELDRRILEEIKQLTPEQMPEALRTLYKEGHKLEFYFIYAPEDLSGSYLLKAKRQITRQLPLGLYVPSNIEFILFVQANGKVQKVGLVHSSGKAEIDQRIYQALSTMRLPAISGATAKEIATLSYPGNYEAMMLGTRTVGAFPNQPHGYWLKGQGALRLGDFKQAVYDFSKAIALNDEFPNRRIMAATYTGRCEAFRALGNLEQATKDCIRAVQFGSRLAKGYLAKAETLMSKGLHTSAFESFDCAILLEPSASAYFKRSTAYLQLGDTTKAEADIAQAIALDPGNISAYLLRARLREAQKQFPAALEDYNRVIDGDPNSAQAYLNRAQLKLKLGKKADASKDAMLAIKLFGQMGDPAKMQQAQKLLK
jgi:tetratricopeptide (TPR) repeat protein